MIWLPPPPAPGNGSFKLPFKLSSNYAYNSRGMFGYGVVTNGGVIGHTDPWRPLGLNNYSLTVPEGRIAAPSEMYEVGDTRPIRFPHVDNGAFVQWQVWMLPWQILPLLHSDGTEAAPPHAGGYNLLFVDGHVNSVKRKDYLYPPRTAQNWMKPWSGTELLKGCGWDCGAWRDAIRFMPAGTIPYGDAPGSKQRIERNYLNGRIKR